MTTPENTMQKFSGEFGGLLNKSIADGTPLAHIIRTMEDAAFELRTLSLAAAKQQAARELTMRIVPPPNGFKF